MVQAQRIPGPPTKPVLGNLTDVDAELGALSIARLIQRYGELIQLDFLSKRRLFAGSQRLVHELSDQTRFEKKVVGALEQARNLAGDGNSFVMLCWNAC
jgi:cytochrome P450/NADPH-cytochrome P450 reductase